MVLGYKTDNFYLRKSFGKIKEIMNIPNLIEVQKNSYDEFLKSINLFNNQESGIHGIFNSIFPISDYSQNVILEYVNYELGTPKYDINECHVRSMTYSAPLRVTFRLIVFDINEETQVKTIKDIKEQEVYMGEIPLMTSNGTFIINGTERVIVSQVHRSPGVLFEHDRGKVHSSGRILFSAHIIPYRGSWLDFQFDIKDSIFCRIDRKRKLNSTTILYAIGYTAEEILSSFYNKILFGKHKDGWILDFNEKNYSGIKLKKDLVDAYTGEIVVKEGRKLTSRLIKKLIETGLEKVFLNYEDILGKFFASDIINEDTGEVYINAGDEVSEELLNFLATKNINDVEVLDIDNLHIGGYILNTLRIDKNNNQEEALIDIYRVMRPGEVPTLEAAEQLFKSMFFDGERYDLSSVGRVKMNMRLSLDCPDDIRVLRTEDIIEVIRVLHDLRDGKGEIDDIDHLGNRRIRSVGELMENQFRIGLLRMERAIKERLSAIATDTVMPQDLINMKPLVSVIREFFGTSQLSQFMDQTNPLSEITHKRRLSALGPGGLSRERAGFEVRDVHPTHYGRICPIETPEGANIGLINSLASYARINKYGFVETPYRKVVDGRLTDEVVHLSALEETKYTIAQANADVNDENYFVNNLIQCRKGGDQFLEHPSKVDFIDVSPKQLVSVAASLIPFLENDDANRALMGSNMQRQAVPLLISESPLVGTGMERVVARDSGAIILAHRDGIIEHVDATRIVIRYVEHENFKKPGIDIFRLRKYHRSNQNTCINQKPCVKVGDVVKKGDVIANSSSTENGELALGKNVLVAFMPWNGYNYEDSILLSERIVHDEVYTSIHIEEFEVSARDTKLGPEEITRDIPNVSEETLRNLDETGIVYIGAEVKAGDVLVGKITPKGESLMTPEEKLLRAIFGEKASDVRDTSLRVPPGVKGTIVEVRVFNRYGLDKDDRAQQIEHDEIKKLLKDKENKIDIIEQYIYFSLKNILANSILMQKPKGVLLSDKPSIDELDQLNKKQLDQIIPSDETILNKINELKEQHKSLIKEINSNFDDKVQKLQQGDELLPGVMKMVKVFIAVKRKIQPGDKMAGRHGNKGVVSNIVPLEDMPFLEDGTPVDIVLNPLGVPSRMNVGQILETHLGWASVNLGKKITKAVNDYLDNISKMGDLRNLLLEIYGKDHYNKIFYTATDDDLLDMCSKLKTGVPMSTPVFDGAKEEDITKYLQMAGYDSSGQVKLYDGKTGEPFDRKVTVGYIYMLKLHHLVDDKIHARSVGPYSLVTQQPLGGKAQFGGQRLGEMEVWALQAYGAAYTLQEMLTIKSDDVAGRTKVYESIVRGDNHFETGLPESFNVLMKEMRSLCLNVELIDNTHEN
jgi:DNA-directed RNA polymerase subunit beta